MIWGLKIIYISEISVYYPALCVGMYYCLLQPPCSLSLIQSVKLISYTSFSPPPLCLYFSSKQMPEHSLFPNKGVMRSGQGGHAGEGWENRGGGERTPVMTSCKKGNQTSSVCAHVLLLETLIY